jgi:hypothetical protein
MPAGDLNPPGRGESTPCSWSAALAVAALFAFTLAFFGPAQILFGNSFDFPFAFTAALPLLLMLAAFMAAVVFSLLMLLKGKWREKALALVFALGLLQWLQGNFLHWDYGPLDGRAIAWGKFGLLGWIDGALWALFIILALALSRRACRLARIAAPALLLVQLISVGFQGWSAPKVEGVEHLVLDSSDRFLFSREKNVIILVLDAFQSDAFQEIVHGDASYGEIFRDFTYFRNNLGGFNGTYFSIPLILTGRYWQGTESIEEYKKEAYLSDSLPFVLKNKGFQVGLYPLQNPGILYDKRVASNFVSRKTLSRKELAFLIDLALFRQLPQALKKKVYNDQLWCLSSLFEDEPLTRSKWNRRARGHRKTIQELNRDVQRIEEFASGLKLTARPVFKYWHWQGLHRPLARNEKCEYEKLAFSRANYLGQARCVLRLVGRFLAGLKNAGIYDRSLIFVVGDHGVTQESLGIFAERSPGVWVLEEGNESTRNLRQGAIPLLLVKRFAAALPEMKVSDAPSILADIPRTVFAELGVKTGVPGISLFDLREGQERPRPFYAISGRGLRKCKLMPFRVDGFSWLPGSWQPLFSGKILPTDID